MTLFDFLTEYNVDIPLYSKLSLSELISLSKKDSNIALDISGYMLARVKHEFESLPELSPVESFEWILAALEINNSLMVESLTSNDALKKKCQAA